MNRVGLGILLLIAGTGCLTTPKSLPPCDSWDSGHSICRLMNPEDLGALPNEDWIVVSEMTHSDSRVQDPEKPFKTGRLTAIRLSERGGEIDRRRLYPQEWDEELPDTIRWGDPTCSGPPTSQDFQPHGLDVGVGPGGEAALAVVTHGLREVIDLFEIADGAEPLLEWRGCVPVPPTVTANDVVLLGDGGLLITNFMPRFEEIGFSALWTLVEISFGSESGAVMRWRPGGSFVEIPNSRGSAPNGIEVSPDGRVVYVAEWGGGRVYRLQLPPDGKGPVVRDAVKVEGSPDNLTWTSDGRLLVAAQKAGPMRALGCGRIEVGGCDVGYAISEIDPEAFRAKTIAEGRGAASVALEVRGDVYVGVFSGDSVIRIERPD